MKCPFCGYKDTKVIDSRPTDERKRRRRECTNCGQRFTTYEVVEKPQLMVYKRDKSFEPFDRLKLCKGIQSAVKKRPVSVDDMNRLVDDIENAFANRMQTETTTEEIGNMVLAGLKKLDHVAYVRFASVYKDFGDVEEFIKIISELSQPADDHSVNESDK
jgi:transcriptional repressor NrdR